VARNFLMDLSARVTPVKFLIRDLAGQFTASFDSVFQVAGIRIIRSAVQAPRMKPLVSHCTSSGRFAGV
jgi:hypothetical protein